MKIETWQPKNIFIIKSRARAKGRHKNTLVVIWPDYTPNQSYYMVHTPYVNQISISLELNQC